MMVRREKGEIFPRRFSKLPLPGQPLPNMRFGAEPHSPQRPTGLATGSGTACVERHYCLAGLGHIDVRAGNRGLRVATSRSQTAPREGRSPTEDTALARSSHRPYEAVYLPATVTPAQKK